MLDDVRMFQRAVADYATESLLFNLQVTNLSSSGMFTCSLHQPSATNVSYRLYIKKKRFQLKENKISPVHISGGIPANEQVHAILALTSTL